MSFDPERDAAGLNKALHADKTDENAIIEIVGNRDLSKRLLIKENYNKNYGNLIDDLESILKGDFGKTTVVMFYNESERDARFLHEAIAGLGTDENCLIEILTTHSNYEIRKIKSEYESVYKKDLQHEIESDTSFNFEKFLVLLLQASRNDTAEPSKSEAKNDAKELYDAGEGKFFGTDEDVFLNIFSKKSFNELSLIFQEYGKISSRTMIEAIKSEFSGNIRDALVTECKFIINKNALYASKFFKAMVGPGTDDSELIRLVVTQENQLESIKKEYNTLFNKSLYDNVKEEASGSFGRLLLEVIKQGRS